MSKDEPELIGRGQIIEGFRRHYKEFGFGPKGSGYLLKGLGQGSNKDRFAFFKCDLIVVKNIL